ncbi:MAG: GH32 C-terminal domain-containing protein [Parabacteroides sp.]|nr:GH32 C-terminal domain-containing protein [Parabacteroides sp.]
MKKIAKRLVALLLCGATLFTPATWAASDGVEVNHLGVNNTLVRVTGNGNYLLFPVEEANDDSRVQVLVDGNIVETIYVRLARSKTDYTVPYDLTPYKGKHVVFEIVTPQGRESVREAKEDACWKGLELADTLDTANQEKYRPAFHHTPLYGWMNDPNGMFYKDGQWHLYYQCNPYGSKWQNMTWGHAVSSDLIHWEHKPNAIKPNGLGTVFSGSCAVDYHNTAGFGKGTVLAMYTSAGTSQMQSLASSTDNGLTFDIYAGNPTLTLESEARDPNMFWNEKTGAWSLVLAHALDREMLFFSSPDMKKWTWQGRFGKGIGAQDGVWECPDLFELPVAGSDETKWMLLCNINPGGPFGGSATQYFIGDFDGKTFQADTDPSGNVPTKWLDYGKDHYATVSWSDAPDNRRTLIGWMSNWQYAADVPTRQFRSANTLPREVGLFRGADGEIYASCAPSPELEGLRDQLVRKVGKADIGWKSCSYSLPTAHDGICEILFEIDTRKSKAVEMTLFNQEGDKVVMKYNSERHTFSFDRRESGLVDFNENFPAVTVSPTFEEKGVISLRLFIDRSSIEVFGDGGRFVMTHLVFPRRPYSQLSFSSEGGNARLGDLKVYSLTTK